MAESLRMTQKRDMPWMEDVEASVREYERLRQDARGGSAPEGFLMREDLTQLLAP